MTTVSTGTRRELNKQATRQAIVDAALSILRNGSDQEMTATNIAETAGISRRTLFNYFPTVDAILAYPVQEFLEQMLDELAPLIERLPLIQAIVEALHSPEVAKMLGQVAQFGAYTKTGGAADCHLSNLIAWQGATDGLIIRIINRYPSADVFAIKVFSHAILGAGEAAFNEWIDRLPEMDRSALEITPELIASFHSLILQAAETLNAGFSSLPLTASNPAKEN